MVVVVVLVARRKVARSLTPLPPCFFLLLRLQVGIPSILFSMLYTAKVNHTMGSVMTKEKFGWIYIRFTYEVHACPLRALPAYAL